MLKRIGLPFCMIFLSMIVSCGIDVANGNIGSSSAASPSISFTYIPVYLSAGDITGMVSNADPAKYKVALYLYTTAWYNKPSWTERLIDIQSNGSWVFSNSGIIYDTQATKFKAFLVTNGTVPPKMGEFVEQTFPADFESNAAAKTLVIRYHGSNRIEFSGYTWLVKSGDFRQDPGQNYFSDESDTVWVDGSGKLHIKAIYKGTNWYCSEICMTNMGLGYGKYIFQVSNRVDLIDKNLDLGLFLFDYWASAPFREFDFEFMDWRDGTDTNAVFVVQPYSTPGNQYKYKIQLDDTNTCTTYIVDWSASSLIFNCYRGYEDETPEASNRLFSWTYTGADLPKTGLEQVHINLWFELVSNRFTTDSNDEEVVIREFRFIPE